MDRPTSFEMVRFWIRYLAVTTKDRVNYNGKVWAITYLRELGRREGIEITAEAVY
jgi:hypothetical protein